jgi:hypothetical protein
MSRTTQAKCKMNGDLLLDRTWIVILLAAGVVGLLTWRLKPHQFSAIGWKPLALGSGIFWGVLGTILVLGFWESYYRHFAPSWARFEIPFIFILYAVIGLGLRWLALHLPGNPVLTFCLLGGIESIPEHALGIYGFHILDISILRGFSPASIFIFAFFEYVVYWGLAFGLAVLLAHLYRPKAKITSPPRI